jgi:hypothetical protein
LLFEIRKVALFEFPEVAAAPLVPRISNFALGEVVPIPTWAFEFAQPKAIIKLKINVFFMFLVGIIWKFRE